MKSPILLLPTILLGAAVFALTMQAPATQPSITTLARNAEIQKLQLELKKTSDRIEKLQVEGHHVVPRGGVSSIRAGIQGYPAGPSLLSESKASATQPGW